MNYQARKKRVKLVKWEKTFEETEREINLACKEVEEVGGNILSIKIFDEVDPEKSPSCAIVYDL